MNQKVIAMSDQYGEADYGAAAAAKDADEVPDYVLHGTPIGHCHACDTRFLYRGNTGIDNLDPCPQCGSLDWRKWGYRVDGEAKPMEVLKADAE